METSFRNLIVFDHPYTLDACRNEPHNRSFCAALAVSIVRKMRERGEEVDIIDLHKDGFDPVMTAEDLANWRRGVPMNDQVADYQRRMLAADRIVFVFPIWWEVMPAMTKGFIDKVYAKNVLYEQGESGLSMQTRLTSGTEFVVVTCMGTPTAVYKVLLRQPLVNVLKKGLCLKTGIRKFTWMPFAGVDKLSAEQRRKILASVDVGR